MVDLRKLNDIYLHNNYFYLTCNCCDRLIKRTELTEEEYDNNNGYCPQCFKELNDKPVYVVRIINGIEYQEEK